ncbi:MAG TPA: cysteine--tRNA ligase [Lacipirellulaceae bacterium]|nr:cysteine--tRNA ligase [Lacipirellulaceae bacterium]
MSTTTHSKPATTDKSSAHPTLRVYNTLSKRKEPFVTVRPDKVGIYLCGPTVYDKAHIGHMVGPVIFDSIKRYLVYNGYDVTWVVNITDVDDKLIKKANERGISMLEVAEENIADYHHNLAALGVDQIDSFPRATECMPEIIQFIKCLVDRGCAYQSDGDVYFDVGKDADYGKLSNRSIDSMQGEGGDTAARKRHAADFALWKSAKPGEPSWESPWGPGRPGWHIECSAMSKKILGETFDIHGGGLDLVFPHHENEIAQSECCHGKPMVLYWAHNGLLRKGAATGKIGGGDAGEKMSRSKGAGGLAELIQRQGGERIRFFLLRTHYRSTVLFNEPAIEEAGVGLETFYRLFKRYTRITGKDFYALATPNLRDSGRQPPALLRAESDPILQAATDCREKFLAAMDDDFNTGGAIGELFELASLANRFCEEKNLEGSTKADAGAVATLEHLMSTIKELANILGLFAQPLAATAGSTDELLSKLMPLVIDLRANARKSKNFAVADKIRDGLAPLGITLEDRAGGTEWTRSGGASDATGGVMQLLIQLRAGARAAKDFALGDEIRNRLAAAGITLEDRAGGTEWTRA